jgi:hypothetical protein
MTVAGCPPETPVIPGVVVFNLTEFTTAWPEFAGVSAGAASAMFSLSELNLKNCCRSAVPNPNVRQQLLYLLTAHMLFLFSPGTWNANTPRNGFVGRISSASEGSVSVSAEFPQSPNAAWFNQTQYGSTFWLLTMSVRTMRYTPPPQNCCGNAVGLGPGGGAGGWPNRWPL